MLPNGSEGGRVLLTPLSSGDTDTEGLSFFPPGLHLSAAHSYVCVWGRGPGPAMLRAQNRQRSRDMSKHGPVGILLARRCGRLS